MGRPREYLALDLETTGLSAATDRVVEIGAVRFDADGCELGRFEQLVHPERRMAPAAEAIHGISDALLAGAPIARAVLPAFLDFLGAPETTLLIAHNSAFDAGFLGRELLRAGLAAPRHAVVDTLALARKVLPNLKNHRLDTLAQLFKLDPHGPHRALADSRRVQGVWLALGGPNELESDLVAYPIAVAPRADTAPVPNGWDGLTEAIARGLRVRIEYTGGTQGSAPREVTPRRFAHKGGFAYLVAFCHIDLSEKKFRLDRVRSYEIVEVLTAG